MADLLDTRILHALQVDGRAPFTRIAAALGVSDDTVARRYHRLHAAGLLRVRGRVDADRSGQAVWIVRAQCPPGGAQRVAEALAGRADVGWLALAAGGSEVVGVVRVRIGGGQLPLDVLARKRGDAVQASAYGVLHTFFGGAVSLVRKSGALTAEQLDMLQRAPAASGTAAGPTLPARADRRLVAALAEDGRASLDELAAATGWSRDTVRRRIAELRDAEALTFEVDFDQALLDLPVRAALWLAVAPERLDAAGQALAGQPQTGFVCATTGPTNLFAGVVAPTGAALYAYLTGPLAAVPGVLRAEVSPVARTVKQAGILGC